MVIKQGTSTIVSCSDSIANGRLTPSASALVSEDIRKCPSTVVAMPSFAVLSQASFRMTKWGMARPSVASCKTGH